MEIGSRQKSRRKVKTFRIEWKWEHNVFRPMEHGDGNSRSRVHSSKCLHQKSEEIPYNIFLKTCATKL